MKRTSARSPRIDWDRLGIIASLLCALHCLSLPLLLTLSTVGILSFLDAPWFEWGMILLALGIAMRSLIQSFPSHKLPFPILMALGGFIFLFSSQLTLHVHDGPLDLGHGLLRGLAMATGGVLVAAAHYWNWRLSRRYNCQRA